MLRSTIFPLRQTATHLRPSILQPILSPLNQLRQFHSTPHRLYIEPAEPTDRTYTAAEYATLHKAKQSWVFSHWLQFIAFCGTAWMYRNEKKKADGLVEWKEMAEEYIAKLEGSAGVGKEERPALLKSPEVRVLEDVE